MKRKDILKKLKELGLLGVKLIEKQLGVKLR